MAAPPPVPVLFIGGDWRSGSTLLGRLLGACEDAVHVGELWHIWERGFHVSMRCGCGQPFRTCPFWNEVVGRAFGGMASVDGPRIEDLQSRVLRLRAIRNVRSARLSRSSTAEYSELARIYQSLFRAIRDVAGARVVVDSSKWSLYGAFLNGMADLHVSTIHLVRDARAVAFSKQRRKLNPRQLEHEEYMLRRSVLASSVNWCRFNLYMEAAFFRRPILRLRYEDTALAPERSVRRIRAFAGLPPAELEQSSPGHFDVPVDHSIDGNPMRFEYGAVEVKLDSEWRRAMPARQRMLVSLVASPLLLRYGYLG